MNRVAARILASLALLITLIGVLRTAWLCDDAYITLRTVDNWVNGYGLRWNVGERVQSYTHPLWLFVLSAVYYFTREPYYTTLAVGLLFSAATLLLVAFVLPKSPAAGIVGVLALAGSHAFVSYSTAGLENPLSNLLLVVFVIELGRVGSTRRLLRLSLIAALLMLTRLDFLLLVAPGLLLELAQLRSRAALRALLLGMLPLVLWELFSFYYYGVFVPNTASAKLHSHIPQHVVLRQGLRWLSYTVRNDWGTALVVLWAAVTALWKRDHHQLACVAGAALYLGYCVAIGGDYSAGRLWLAPMVFSLALLVHRSGRPASVGLALITLSTLLLTVRPVPFAGNPDHPLPNEVGVWDDRGFYFPHTGLIHAGLHAHGPLIDWGRWGEAEGKRPGRTIVFRAVGQYGYFAGPGIHVIDDMALCDPLLARLRPITESKLTPGHLLRAIPAGYVESIGATNVISDPSLRDFYGPLSEIIRGPLWSWSRIKKSIALNLGQYQPLLKQYERNNPHHD